MPCLCPAAVLHFALLSHCPNQPSPLLLLPQVKVEKNTTIEISG